MIAAAVVTGLWSSPRGPVRSVCCWPRRGERHRSAEAQGCVLASQARRRCRRVRRRRAAGEYLLQPDEDPSSVLRVGEVLRVADGKVHRALVGAPERSWMPADTRSAHGGTPHRRDRLVRVRAQAGGDGETRDAWLFPGDPAHWVIHVQGIRTSRGVTLRTVAIAHEAGATSLTITYRRRRDGPPSRAATLGAREWTELRDAITYARSQGAQRVTVVAWSMGAALMFEPRSR